MTLDTQTFEDRSSDHAVQARAVASLFQVLEEIAAPTLIVHSDEDLIFFGDEVRETASIIRSDGTPVEIVELAGTRGHLDGVLSIAQAGAKIQAFLDR